MSVKLIKIGRSPENDIVIDDDSVSRFHLELFQDEQGNVFITDLESTNGTTVNGKRLEESEILNRKDVVGLGSVGPLPWQSYFVEGQPIIVSDTAAPKKEQDASKSNFWYKIASIVAFITLITVLLYFYRDSIFGVNENNETDTDAQQEQTNELYAENQNDSALIEKQERQEKQRPKENIPYPISDTIFYSYECMGNDFLNDISDLETGIIDGFSQNVSMSEEREVGRQLYDACRDEYQFISDNKYSKINSIKNRLVKTIAKPRGFNYSIYLIKSSDINAFTAGGYIFVTTGMYDFAANDDELACIIGHEIAHNECKHINQQLKREKVNQAIFGELFGSAADALSFILTSPFNQKKETESDFHGIDYAVAAGYDGCTAINLWKRMSNLETEGDKIDEMMRTHPYSSKRSSCCRSHIEANYNFECP